MNKLYFFFIILLFASKGQGQISDSLVIPKHRHLKANVTMTAFNITLNRGNRYLLESGKDWADVSLDSWKENLGKLPEWDWDLYTTNWFAHPYQGSFYYNCARSLKMSQWQSMGYTLLGTTIWEYLGEDLPPSFNDFIATTSGGIILGEMLFRLSENILDDKSYGGKRRKKEILAALINPMGGANRLFYNHINQHEGFINHIHLPVTTTLSVSTKYLLATSLKSNQLIIPDFSIDIEYGEMKKKAEVYRPFELFWLKSWLRFDKYNQDKKGFQVPLPFLNISSSAVLYAKVYRSINSKADMWAIFQDYDYLNNYTYSFSSLSFTAGGTLSTDGNFIRSRHRIQAGPVVLAAVQSEAVDQIRPSDTGDERDYIMGPGYTLKIKSTFQTDKLGSLEIQYDFWNIFVEPGPDGKEKIHRINSRYKIPVTKNISVAFGYNYYKRLGLYDYLSSGEKLQDYNSEIQFSTLFHIN